MATKWEFDYAVGMGMPVEFSPAEPPAYMYGMPAVEKLRIEDLLDFTNHELLLSSSSSSSAVAETTKLLTEPQLTDAAAAATAAAATDFEYIYPCRASFADDIYMPRDEVAELEWLSKFVEDSFSDVPVHSPAAEAMVQSTTSHRENMPASCRGARSKRSRGVAAAAAAAAAESSRMPWSSLASSSSTTSSSSSSDFPALNAGIRKMQEVTDTGTDGATRRCTHCASEKTPQWRTGPFGPKTLCNACGVRYKSGRLVPEYRPAASPTFLLTQHSNSHRKVLELRRQKELNGRYNDNSSSSASAAIPEMLFIDYDVC